MSKYNHKVFKFEGGKINSECECKYGIPSFPCVVFRGKLVQTGSPLEETIVTEASAFSSKHFGTIVIDKDANMIDSASMLFYHFEDEFKQFKTISEKCERFYYYEEVKFFNEIKNYGETFIVGTYFCLENAEDLYPFIGQNNEEGILIFSSTLLNTLLSIKVKMNINGEYIVNIVNEADLSRELTNYFNGKEYTFDNKWLSMKDFTQYLEDVPHIKKELSKIYDEIDSEHEILESELDRSMNNDMVLLEDELDRILVDISSEKKTPR